MEQHHVTDIAIYLRKSRDESDGHEDVLLKHQTVLVELAEKNGWKYTIYREIGSSDSIDARPEMLRLLRDIEQGLFDAVLVVDTDRLSRGDKEQQGKIERILRESDTLVMTPAKVYNYNDDDQLVEREIGSLFARMEYITIKRRLNRGKKIGAKLGHFVNGKAPLGYRYDPGTKKLEPDATTAPIYRMVVEMFLSGKPSYEVAWELNRQGIRTPRGKVWTEVLVHRLVTSDTHRGWVTYGKTKGSGHKNRKTGRSLEKLPPEQWTVVKDAHPSLKTEEEHARILALLQSRKVVPMRSRRGTYVLSGVVRCGKCGNTHQFLAKKNGTVMTKICQHSDPYGNKCGNRGLNVEILLAVLGKRLEAYRGELLTAVPEENGEVDRLQRLLQTHIADLEKLNVALERLGERYDMGDMTKTEYMERRDKRKTEIAAKKEEIEKVKASIGHYGTLSKEERLARIAEFELVWHSDEVPPREKNRLLKLICHSIEYVRVGDDVNVKINFL